MDIRESLLKEHTKHQVQLIAGWIGSDRQRFADLLALMLNGQDQVRQRAAWAFSHCLEQYPELLHPHLEALVEHLLGEILPDAVKRNILKALQEAEIPESLWGAVADIAFQSLADPREAVAIRVFSMTVAWNICRKVPELRSELKLIIEDQWEFSSAGFRARGKRILREIKKSEAAEKK